VGSNPIIRSQESRWSDTPLEFSEPFRLTREARLRPSGQTPVANRRQLKPHQLGKTGRACKVNLKTKAAIVVMVIVSAFAAASVATAAPDSGPATYVFKTFPLPASKPREVALGTGVYASTCINRITPGTPAPTLTFVCTGYLVSGTAPQRDVRTQGKLTDGYSRLVITTSGHFELSYPVVLCGSGCPSP
jgi:hypothetical protein